MMHAEKDFFEKISLLSFYILVLDFSTLKHCLTAWLICQSCLRCESTKENGKWVFSFFFFDIFDILHFLHWWTSQGQNIEQMASKTRSVTINKIAKLEWMMVYNFQLKFEISFYCINLRFKTVLIGNIRKPVVSPIFSHGCPDFMSHPSMQFRIIKSSGGMSQSHSHLM